MTDRVLWLREKGAAVRDMADHLHDGVDLRDEWCREAHAEAMKHLRDVADSYDSMADSLAKSQQRR